MIDKKIQDELRIKYNPDGSDLRKAQLKMLELLKFLNKICSENNLNYWLDSGTLLGAVRHGGFIPWDDDIDVCMPYKDAVVLKKIMGEKIYNNHIVLQNEKTDSNFIHVGWMALRDTKTMYIPIDNPKDDNKFNGIQVDIFLVESGISKWSKTIPNLINLYFIEGLLRKNSTRKFNRIIANISVRFQRKFIVPLLRLFRTKNKIYDYAIGNPFRMRQAAKDIFPLKKILFENISFNAPNNCENYLKVIYGNWESIPNPKSIRTHNVTFRFKE